MTKLLVIAATVLLALALVARAEAGTFDVVACASAANGANHSWISASTAPSYALTIEGCPALDAGPGLNAFDNLRATANAPGGTSAAWRFMAPPGTSVSTFRYSRYLGKDGDDGWQVYVKTTDGQVLDTCAIAPSELGCTVGQADYDARAERVVRGLTASGLAVGLTCEPILGGSSCSVGVNRHGVWATLHSATVTLVDDSAPAVSNFQSPLLAAAFATGTQLLTFTATDNAGIRAARIYVDGTVATSTTYGCDFTYTVPCANRDGAQLVLDTRSLSDGPHQVQIAAVDPAGNETQSTPADIVVDNTAPRPPLDLSVDGGPDWRSANSFDVRWRNPSDPGAPISAAHFRLCAVDGSGCQPAQTRTGDGISQISGISVPSQGEWALRLWLEDAAGNVDPDQATEISLRYGIAPGGALLPAPTASTPPVSSDRDATTSVISDPVSPPSLSDPTPAPQTSTTTTRLDPRLRLSRPKTTAHRVLIRGVLARNARGRVSLTIRPRHGRVVRRSATIRSGRFALSLPRTALRSVVVSYAGSATFRAARAALKLSR